MEQHFEFIGVVKSINAANIQWISGFALCLLGKISGLFLSKMADSFPYLGVMLGLLPRTQDAINMLTATSILEIRQQR